jgi:hypothetical protein
MTSSQGGVQMAANTAPAQMMPNTLQNWAASQMSKADSIASGPLGRFDTYPAGQGYSGMVGKTTPLK